HRHNPFGRIAHETAASFFPADPPQFYMVPFSYYQIDLIKETLIDAGFTDISVAVIRQEKEIPDAARFARGLVYGNPLIDQIKARGGVDPNRIVDALGSSRSSDLIETSPFREIGRGGSARRGRANVAGATACFMHYQTTAPHQPLTTRWRTAGLGYLRGLPPAIFVGLGVRA